VIQAFQGFVQQVGAGGGRLLAWGDAPLVRQVCAGAAGDVIFYGLEPDAAWRAGEIEPASGGMNFTVYQQGRRWGRFFTPLLGTHNVWNSLAAVAALAELGEEPEAIQKALAGFLGVKRRLEAAGEYKGVLVLEDFAHHPTAVAVTLEGVRQGYPGRRLVAVFEPRTNTSRRRVFQEPYARAFKDADLVIVREPPDLWKVPEEEQFSSIRLVEDLRSQGQEAFYFPDTDLLLAALLEKLRPGDVALIMSNGGFDNLVPRLAAALDGEK